MLGFSRARAASSLLLLKHSRLTCVLPGRGALLDVVWEPAYRSTCSVLHTCNRLLLSKQGLLAGQEGWAGSEDVTGFWCRSALVACTEGCLERDQSTAPPRRGCDGNALQAAVTEAVRLAGLW